jgi:predicted nucleic acid-binding protein
MSFYSDVMLREIKQILSEQEFQEKVSSLRTDCLFEKTRVIKEDLIRARKLEFETKFSVSFYDLVHLCIAKRIDSILVTRDAELLKVAKKHIFADKPENLIIY